MNATIEQKKAEVAALADKAREHEAKHGKGYNPYDAQHDEAVDALCEARIQHIVENFDSFRAAWNEGVAKRQNNGNLTGHDIKAIEAEVGASMDEIKEAKARI